MNRGYFVPLEAADEADVVDVVLFGLVLVAQLCEGVDDDAEYDVHEDDVDHREAGEVVPPPNVVADLVVVLERLPQQHVSDGPGRPRPLRDLGLPAR